MKGTVASGDHKGKDSKNIVEMKRKSLKKQRKIEKRGDSERRENAAHIKNQLIKCIRMFVKRIGKGGDSVEKKPRRGKEEKDIVEELSFAVPGRKKSDSVLAGDEYIPKSGIKEDAVREQKREGSFGKKPEPVQEQIYMPAQISPVNQIQDSIKIQDHSTPRERVHEGEGFVIVNRDVIIHTDEVIT